MLMDNKFEVNVPYVKYQMLKKDNEFWEVSVPANLNINDISINHWKVTNEIKFDWAGYPEIKLHEVDKNFDCWMRVELISMGHLLMTHYFQTEKLAKEYMKYILMERNKTK